MAKVTKWGSTYKVLMDVGFVANQFILDTSELDGFAVLDGSTNFVDITQYVTNININRGRATQVDLFPSSTCTIVADDRAADRYFDPLNASSAWYSGGTIGIAPRRKFEVYGGTAGTKAMFTGYVYDLNLDYAEPNLSTATIVATDALGQLGQTVLTGFNPSSQLTSARVSAILDRPEVAFSTALRSIETGVATCGTVAYPDATNALQALNDVAVAEGGRFFVDRSGFVNFDARVGAASGTAIASFGGTAGLPIQSLSNEYGAETVLNRVAVQIDGGTASSVASGTASQAQYGIKTLALTGVPLVDNASGSALASFLVSRFENPTVQFSGFTVLLNALTAAQQEVVAGLEIGDLVSVSKSFNVGSPSAVSQNVVVESIRHSINPNRHDVTVGLGQIRLAFVLNTSNLDDPDYGLQ
ncbi:hypothetical protein UFOVP943_33 [uncultured Caudovirales phage]|uniref:Uncharacterized protein n=1 Tax=uncultured Caudovirales phage TaxID=2100421 RepID=A0A6J5QWS3_9CAUD|nr:hypothetical protein UFOVP943_33 [uncultured Caudovirales phage]CAB4184064.1 hypothetical protein UFOVP1111_28 [uncultured Caudovirales phage]CAB4203334.1 hypothetical protein UFOVP1380_33 [uncultured Caudovirales phage]